MNNSMPLPDEHLTTWFMRKTLTSAVRRVADLPIAIGTDIGTIRTENEDRVSVIRFYSEINGIVQICVLCDGMGGMSKGALCASIALATFFTTCYRKRDFSLSAMLHDAAIEANLAVHRKMGGDGGCTLSSVAVTSRGLVATVNVGDSRIYKLSGGLLTQLSRDDTLEGHLGSDNPHKNELLQFIGMGSGVEPHITEVDENFERLILTSDGAHYLERKVLEMLFRNASDAALAVKRVTDVARWCSGHDNATVAIMTPFRQSSFDISYTNNLLQVWDSFGDLTMVLSDDAQAVKSDARTVELEPPKPINKLDTYEKKAQEFTKELIIGQVNYTKNKRDEAETKAKSKKKSSQKSKTGTKRKSDLSELVLNIQLSENNEGKK